MGAALAAKSSVLYFVRIATVAAIGGVFMKRPAMNKPCHPYASADAATWAVMIDHYLVEYGVDSSFSMACIGGRSADR
jgi:hypothetical protein